MIKNKIILFGLMIATSFSCWSQQRSFTPSTHLMTSALLSSVRFPHGSMAYADRSQAQVNSSSERSFRYPYIKGADYKTGRRGGVRHHDFNLKQPRSRDCSAEKNQASEKNQLVDPNALVVRTFQLDEINGAIERLNAIEVDNDQLEEAKEMLASSYLYLQRKMRDLSYVMWDDRVNAWWDSFFIVYEQEKVEIAQENIDKRIIKQGFNPKLKLDSKSRRKMIYKLNKVSKVAGREEISPEVIQRKFLEKSKQLQINKPSKASKREEMRAIAQDQEEVDGSSWSLASRKQHLQKMKQQIDYIKARDKDLKDFSLHILLRETHEKMNSLLFSSEDDEWDSLYNYFYEIVEELEIKYVSAYREYLIRAIRQDLIIEEIKKDSQEIINLYQNDEAKMNDIFEELSLKLNNIAIAISDDLSDSERESLIFNFYAYRDWLWAEYLTDSGHGFNSSVVNDSNYFGLEHNSSSYDGASNVPDCFDQDQQSDGSQESTDSLAKDLGSMSFEEDSQDEESGEFLNYKQFAESKYHRHAKK